MITGDLKHKVDQLWSTFWSGGISNPLPVIEQITYLLFAKRLDDLQLAEEAKAHVLNNRAKKVIFNEDQAHLRWSNFKDFDPERKFVVFRDEVFPFIKSLNGRAGSSYTKFMHDAVFAIPHAALFDRVVNMIDNIPMEDRDTKGDLYEYMLSKISTAGQNGQFRTPRHIIKMMVELAAPTPEDTICDPACGTCGFLISCAEYLEAHHKEMFYKEPLKEHFHNSMFFGSDFDSSMLRIGAMNMTLHGITNPVIESRDSLSEEQAGRRDAYSLILANPPFKGSLDYDGTATDLLRINKTKKTELLFVTLFLQQLQPGGRCACVVPDGFLFGVSKAHKSLRYLLVEKHQLNAVISMPPGIFKPYAGVSTAVLLFTRTDSGGTDDVWFFDMQADGYNLDDKREQSSENDIPHLLRSWRARHTEDQTDRSRPAFFVPKEEIVRNNYDLTINRYKALNYQPEEHVSPKELVSRLQLLDTQISRELANLEAEL